MVSSTESPSTAAPVRQPPMDFDIVNTYRQILADDAHHTKPVAAIQALVVLLSTMQSKTVFETLETIKLHADRLRDSVANPVPLTAGTDLFLQYIVSSLKQQDGDFDALRAHLVRNGRLFAERAVSARNGVAEAGYRLVPEGKCVLTHGASRCVLSLLRRASKNLGGNMTVVYVRDAARVEESNRVVAQLRETGISVAEVPETAVAHIMGLLRRVNLVFVGAEAVTSSGGIISRMGTFQIARLAAGNKPKIPFYVAAETHKFSRKFCFDQRDLGFTQDVLHFGTDASSTMPEDAVDYTPPELITNLVTENGIHLPAYVFEQLLDVFNGDLRRDVVGSLDG